MTLEEHAALALRLQKAQRIAERLETTLRTLKAIQGGSEACEQHEDVAERLQMNPPYQLQELRGFQVLVEHTRYSMEFSADMTMPPEVATALREAVRALVRYLKAEYEAS